MSGRNSKKIRMLAVRFMTWRCTPADQPLVQEMREQTELARNRHDGNPHRIAKSAFRKRKARSATPPSNHMPTKSNRRAWTVRQKEQREAVYAAVRREKVGF